MMPRMRYSCSRCSAQRDVWLVKAICLFVASARSVRMTRPVNLATMPPLLQYLAL
jgi:hypothetical protein